MTFGETIKEARKAKGLNYTQVGRRANVTPNGIPLIEGDIRQPTYEIAEALCKALGVAYPLNEFPHRKRYKDGPVVIKSLKKPDEEEQARAEKIKRKDTIIEDEAEGRKLGISGSMYRTYVDTGYIKTFRAQVEALRERDKGANIIESHIGGSSGGGRRPQSIEVSKM